MTEAEAHLGLLANMHMATSIRRIELAHATGNTVVDAETMRSAGMSEPQITAVQLNHLRAQALARGSA